MTVDSNIAKSEKPVHDSEADELRAYTRKKLALATQLRALLRVLKQRKNETRIRRCEELMVKLAEDRFTLAVLGQFKRGKSSLMNAIIGRELLPTGVLPLTSAITILKYGPAERLVIEREGVPFPTIEAVSRLANYVTERGNPGNRKKVKAAYVEVPLPFLRRGLEFVDTPGIGSAIEANTATTYSFLPECDGALFITSVDSPLTAVELDFLRTIRSYIRKLFFVLNKTDLITDKQEGEEVLRFVTEQLRQETGVESIRVFPLSARSAFDQSSDGTVSGLGELQSALAKFLSEEKSSVFLTAVLEKALRIVEEQSSDLELHRRASALPPEKARARLNELRLCWKDLALAREKLISGLENEFRQSLGEAAAAELDELKCAESEELSRQLIDLIKGSRWHLADEIGQRWAALVSKRHAECLSEWLARFSSEMKTRWEQLIAGISPRLEANLREILALAASAFQCDSQSVDDLLPRADVTPLFSHQLQRPQPISWQFNWRLCLPAAVVARSLRALLTQRMSDFFATEREQALTGIEDSAKRMVDEFSLRLNRAASELEAQTALAIAGEAAGASESKRNGNKITEPDTAASLRLVHEKVLGLRDGTVDVDSTIAEPAEEAVRVDIPMPKPKAPARFEFAVDLKTRGCAVCDHVVATAFDFFVQWQYAVCINEKAQKDFATEQGFCPLHMWQLHSVSSTLGEAIGLARLVEQIALRLEQSETKLIVRTSANCRVCELLRDAEAKYVERLAQFVGGENGKAVYARSQGVCLRHLELLTSHLRDETGKFVLDHALRRFQETAEDMQHYAIKRDALRRNLGNKDEEDAYLRALIHLVGAKDFCTPWPEDTEI